MATVPLTDREAEQRDALVGRLFEATIGALDVFSVYLGDRLGLETLYLGAIVALALRIFNNLGFIRRSIITRWRSRQRQTP